MYIYIYNNTEDSSVDGLKKMEKTWKDGVYILVKTSGQSCVHHASPPAALCSMCFIGCSPVFNVFVKHIC